MIHYEVHAEHDGFVFQSYDEHAAKMYVEQANKTVEQEHEIRVVEE